jgi:hypothetical protein
MIFYPKLEYSDANNRAAEAPLNTRSIILSTLFSDALNITLLLRVIDQISYPCKQKVTTSTSLIIAYNPNIYHRQY